MSHKSIDAGFGGEAARPLDPLAKFATLLEFGRWADLERQAATFIKANADRRDFDFELGMAHQYLGHALDARGEWHQSVDAARQGNFLLFRWGAPQTDRAIGVGCYLVAHGMSKTDEWGEAAMLAKLSLRALEFCEEKPSRADALFLLAEVLPHLGDDGANRDGVREILTNLLNDKPAVADAESFFAGVSERLASLDS